MQTSPTCWTSIFRRTENHLWRSRTTSQRVNELAPNMGFLNLTKEMTTDSRWGMEVGIRRLRRKNLWLPAGRAAGRGLGYPPAHAAGERVLSRPRRKWLLLTVMDNGDTPGYLARTHHIRRVPDFWSVTGSPLKKLICQATMSSLGSGVLVQ